VLFSKRESLKAQVFDLIYHVALCLLSFLECSSLYNFCNYYNQIMTHCIYLNRCMNICRIRALIYRSKSHDYGLCSHHQLISVHLEFSMKMEFSLRRICGFKFSSGTYIFIFISYHSFNINTIQIPSVNTAF